jgi:outer membrane lipoprotein SlyB
MLRFSLRPAACVMMLLAASCARSAVSPAPDTTAVPAAENGTLLTVRPVATPTDSAGAHWRDLLLDGAAATPGAGRAVRIAEYIVRVDDGSTISIVQADDAALRPGRRVMILRNRQSSGPVTLSGL